MWKVTRQHDEPLPPFNNATIATNVSNATVLVIDLTSFPLSNAFQVNTPSQKNPLNSFFAIAAQGGDLLVAFGPTKNSVNTITTSISSSISAAGVVTAGANDAAPIFNATTFVVKLPPGANPQGATGGVKNWAANSQARWVGLLANGTVANVVARMWQYSQ